MVFNAARDAGVKRVVLPRVLGPVGEGQQGYQAGRGALEVGDRVVVNGESQAPQEH